ncbi:hypothetical protein O6H91_17G051200 [Diphasiastrum complanatum]|uniref:Uncharacterized protein n=1 Tax=Diphasiastrum complanatum TaxID=34168 RepID=A0ACC2B6P7_DIPCM|nr:hypothetical protein O6H91_17G051200 [Diphasiastrum complanatum]
MAVKVETSRDEGQDEKFDKSPVRVEDIMAEMQQMQRALPIRPAMKQVEAARAAIAAADKLLILRLEKLFSQPRPAAVPTSVYRAFQEMREDVVRAEVEEQKRPWLAVLDLEDRHRHYDSLIQRVQAGIRSPSRVLGVVAKESNMIENHGEGLRKLLSASFLSNDEDCGNRLSDNNPVSLGYFHSYKKDSPNQSEIASLLQNRRSTVDDSEIKTVSPKSVHRSSIGFSKSTETAERISATPFDSNAPAVGPNSSGSLSIPTALSNGSLSHSSSSSSSAFEPLSTIHEDGTGNLLSPKLIAILEKAIETGPQNLDLRGTHFEGLVAFPESIGLVTSLTTLNLSGIELQILPESIGALTNLVNLELEANQLRTLPESLGCLSCLKVLDIEKNMIEELPWTIGHCTALEELRADFNKLKGLPEAVGNLCHLRYLSVHLNSLKSLPTTVGNLKALEELDLHFNQLEYIPESLCSLTSLRRLDLSSNFTELKALPKSIGNLWGLQELNISYNHITVLPDTFANLTQLSKLHLDGNPFRDPPLHITEKGKEAVLEYMKQKLNRQEHEKTLKRKRSLFSKFSFSWTGLATRKADKKIAVTGLDILA